MLKHFITTIDYAKLIKLQASQTSPYIMAGNIPSKGNIKNVNVKVKAKRFKK